jgi:hypothetical protein
MLTPDSTPIRAGLLAYGMSGKVFHAPFLTLHPGFDLQAVVQRHEQRMQADYPHIRSYASVEELLADPSLELVVVNTPSFTHVELAKQALRAGKHVLLEKPVATTVGPAAGAPPAGLPKPPLGHRLLGCAPGGGKRAAGPAHRGAFSLRPLQDPA